MTGMFEENDRKQESGIAARRGFFGRVNPFGGRSVRGDEASGRRFGSRILRDDPLGLGDLFGGGEENQDRGRGRGSDGRQNGGRSGGNGRRGNGSGGRNGGNGSGNNNDGNGNKQPRPNMFILLLVTVMAFVAVSYFMRDNGDSRRISYNDFIKYIQQDKVTEVDMKSDRLEIHLKDSDAVLFTGMAESSDALAQRLLEAKITYNPYVPDSSGMVFSFLLSYVFPILLMWGLLSILFRRMGGGRGGIFGVGKSTAKEYVQKETGVTFKDVAGEDEAKESLVEVVDFLHNPQRYAGIGAKLPKGALLVGPPGTGKTLLARAVAGEAHVPFFSLTGSDFIELYVGVGASRVRDLFKEATKNAPCIIFIDEIDAIGRSRDSRYGGGNEEREQTLNQLLSEMDGFESDKGILVIGATNRPEILDKALLRPGRFDRRIIVDRPDLKGRVAILKVHANDVKMDETVDLEEIALATSGAVGSDLANMINEAAINAVKDHRQYVSQKDLFEAVEQVLVGKEKKDRIMSKEERRIVSYHEVGHALINAVQKNAEPVQKITIVPRTMGALGYVMQVPEEEKYLNSKAELEAMIIGFLGGRAAEELRFDSVTTGAANDIERATALARNMVTQYGMSERFGLMGLATVESQYLEGRTVLNCSDVTAAAVDEEVRRILERSYAEAKRILSENLDALDVIADFLIRQETITGKEFMKMFDTVRAARKITADSAQQTASEAGQALAGNAQESAVETSSQASAEKAKTAPVETTKTASAETAQAASAETALTAAAETAQTAAAETMQTAPAEMMQAAPAEAKQTVSETANETPSSVKAAPELFPFTQNFSGKKQEASEKAGIVRNPMAEAPEAVVSGEQGEIPEAKENGRQNRRSDAPRGRFSGASLDDLNLFDE